MKFPLSCLGCKPNQTVLFLYTDEHGQNQEIILSVSQIKGQQTRLSIEAPKAVNVVRGELLLLDDTGASHLI
ncbi:MAG: hypothetical protein C9356_05640 [Oleiphilus sp.]|nr:MAG: hypothetical protein C9356_05640 [Oleiphilus sp.]